MSKQLTTADLAHSKKLDSVTSVELQPADIMVADNTVGGVDKSEEEKIELAFKDKERQEDGEVEMAVSDSKAPSPIEGPSNGDIEPRKWKWAVIFLCFYGFMSSIKPGEPFITPYLLSPEKNFTKKQVTNEITPVLTYSNMAVLVPAFLLTDLLRYKPVLVIQGISQVVIWVILLLGTTLLEMQFMEFFYGIHMACRVAYSSYIFSLVSPVLYQRVAGYSRSSVLLGVFSSSALGQLCMSLGNISFFNLSAISLGFVSFSLLLSLFLPWPKRSLFFNRTQDKEQNKQAAEASKSELDKIKPKETQATSVSSMSSWKKSVFVQMLLEVRDVVKKPDLRLWSLWWVLNSTGYYLVLYYVHILWNEVYPATVYNGGVEAASTLLSALTAFIAGFVKIRWNVWSELVIGIVTAVQAGLLLLMATTHNIWVCYISYVIFRGSHQFLVPVASFRIASSLSKELCALVFGINTFLGTVLTSIISLIISDKRVLSLDVRTQFLLYLSYFIILTVIYLVTAAVVIIRQYRNQQRTRRGAQDQAASTELRHVAVNSEIELLSNSKSVVA